MSILLRPYSPVWNKYRPVIVKMMVDAADEPQRYKMSAHEFYAMNAFKGGYSFTLHVSKGKALNNIRNSVIAQNLLEVLQVSRRASELAEETPYEITMNKQFVLQVNKLSLENA